MPRRKSLKMSLLNLVIHQKVVIYSVSYGV